MAQDEYIDPLWAEQIPQRLVEGAKHVATQVGVLRGKTALLPIVPGAYLYVVFLICLNLGLYLVQYYRTGSAVIADNPSWIVFPIVLLLVTFTNQHLRDRYAATLTQIQITKRSQQECAAFRQLTPPAAKRLLFLVFLVAYYGYIIGFGRIATISTYEGVSGLIIWLVLAPFGYAPILVEAIAIYFSIHFLFPHKLKSHEIRLDYLDPDNFGGLKPVGELLKYSHYLFSISLTLFTLFIYVPFIFPQYFVTPYRPPDGFITVFVGLLWSVGIISLTYSMVGIYQYMKRRRESVLANCERRLEEQLGSRYEFERLFVGDEIDQDLARQLRLLDQVQRTHDFPVTFSMWTQIAASTMLPILVELGLRTATTAV